LPSAAAGLSTSAVISIPRKNKALLPIFGQKS
jgi:hypothetical protein